MAAEAAAAKKAVETKPASEAAPKATVSTSTAGIGVVSGGEAGGKVLPKETVSAETLDFLKKYKQ